jgi:hypothetical protein
MSYIVPTTYHIIVANYATVGKLMEIYFHNGTLTVLYLIALQVVLLSKQSRPPV